MKKYLLILSTLVVFLYANDATETFDKGMAYLLGNGVTQSKEKAFELLTKASKQGSCEAQYNLALMYYMGDGVEQNISKAAELLERSAQKGYLKAVDNVGRVYMQLLKLDKALPWLEKNTKNGDTEANYLLAEIYVEKEDFHQAKKYAKKAIEEGSLAAKDLWDTYNLSSYK